ncbi:MAG: hypothetical protein MUE85_12620 [Microscillaceae bacterium]|jgi:hypothetical protein|nr:hypothetical protein [Microscillaceae bacterium]
MWADYNLLPWHNITLVSSFSAIEIHTRLQAATRPPHIPRTYTLSTELTVLRRRSNEPYLFEGKLTAHHFKIFLHSNYPEHFTPIISGKIETSSRGSIVFLHYGLMNGTWFIWGLGMLVFLCVALFLVWIKQDWLTLGLAGLFFGAAYTVFLFNFRQKVKIAHHILLKTLFDDEAHS